MWDTSGQERVRALTGSYYRGSHGVMVCFSLADRHSFEIIDEWMIEVEKHCSDNISKLLVGCKSDLKREVTEQEAQEIALKYEMLYIETSAKHNTNVDSAFDMLI